MSGANRPMPYSDYGGIIAQHGARFAPSWRPAQSGASFPPPSYGRYSNSFVVPRMFLGSPVLAQAPSGDTTSRGGWLTRADREALWDHSRAEVNRMRATHITILQRDNRQTFWGVNMEQCRIPWSELRNSEVPPQFFLIYNSQTGEHECHLSFDVDDRRWMD